MHIVNGNIRVRSTVTPEVMIGAEKFARWMGWRARLKWKFDIQETSFEKKTRSPAFYLDRQKN